MMKYHTLHDAENCLRQAGYKYKLCGNYISSQCPLHNGEDLNCQISLTSNNRLFCKCHSHHCKGGSSGKGFFLDEVFPELKDEDYKASKREDTPPKPVVYAKGDLFPLWESLKPLPKEPIFKGIDNEELEELGWRWIENGPHGLGTGVFIPYWDKLNQGPLRFAQVRHLTGKVRFNFPKNYKPTVFGKWVISDLLEDEDRLPLAICEGSHDAVVLNHCNVPAVAMPSSSSTELMANLAEFCHKEHIPIIYAGDNDEAGNKLRHVLDQGKATYRVKSPKPYKDWGEMFEAGGFNYIDKVFNGESVAEDIETRRRWIANVQQVFPGATLLTPQP